MDPQSSSSPHPELPARVLVVSDRSWLPARSGGEIRTRSLVRALAGLCRVDGFAITGSFAEGPPTSGVRLHVSRTADPEAIARAFRSLDWLRRPEGHATDALFTPAILAELEALTPPDGRGVVILESLGLQRFIEPLVAAGHRVALYTFGVEALMAEAIAARQPGSLGHLAAARTRLAERRAFATADQVWVCSQADGERIRIEYGDGPAIHVVPNTVELPEAGSLRQPSSGSVAAVYPGTLDYPPNRQAALRLAQTILPLVRREVPDATVALVGRNPPPAVMAAGEDPGVTVSGEVPDMGPYLAAADALVVPLEAGSGTRLKILEAFAARLPVISSAKGIEGIEAVPDHHYLAAETDEEFAAALTRLARDPALGRALAEHAFALVRDDYSTDALPKYLVPALSELAAGGRRPANVGGG